MIKIAGEIKIDAQCRVEIIPDSESKSPLKKIGSKHHSKFQLFGLEKNITFQAADHRSDSLTSTINVK